ncbi:hypothetical protein [uncultured Dokdonia sp.]|uniref:hypothetical protein n=1 Tax=uncultured Dokdonia sp. TaxID=575653 RepID=UPI0026267C39|nr:hypothetical protein [uncultured Dokdonia sp.]
MKIILKIVGVLLVFISFQSHGQQTQSTGFITTSTYNFNTGAIHSPSTFALTLGKQGISKVFDPSYGLSRHIDLTAVIHSYKQNLLSDTFVDTSFIYKKEIPGTTTNSTRPRSTNLESFIVTGIINTIFN